MEVGATLLDFTRNLFVIVCISPVYFSVVAGGVYSITRTRTPGNSSGGADHDQRQRPITYLCIKLPISIFYCHEASGQIDPWSNLLVEFTQTIIYLRCIFWSVFSAGSFTFQQVVDGDQERANHMATVMLSQVKKSGQIYRTLHMSHHLAILHPLVGSFDWKKKVCLASASPGCISQDSVQSKSSYLWSLVLNLCVPFWSCIHIMWRFDPALPINLNSFMP